MRSCTVPGYYIIILATRALFRTSKTRYSAYGFLQTYMPHRFKQKLDLIRLIQMLTDSDSVGFGIVPRYIDTGADVAAPIDLE